MKSFKQLMEEIRIINESKKGISASVAKRASAARRAAIDGEHFENALSILSRNSKAEVPMHDRMDPQKDLERHNAIVSQARAVVNGFRGRGNATVVRNPKGSPHDFTRTKTTSGGVKTTDIDVKVSQQTRRRQLKVGTFSGEKSDSTEVSSEKPETFYRTVHSIVKRSPGFKNLGIDFNKNPKDRTLKNLQIVLDHIENHPHLTLENKPDQRRPRAHAVRRRLRGYFAKIPSERLNDSNYKAKLIGVRPDSKRKGKVKVTVIDKKEHIDAPDENFLGTTSGNKSLSHGRFRFSEDGGNIVVHLRHQHPKAQPKR